MVVFAHNTVSSRNTSSRRLCFGCEQCEIIIIIIIIIIINTGMNMYQNQ